jgi:protein-glutamine gamma-glutamyltransferase
VNLVFLFRRLVFAQVLLGIVSFCMAERNPAMLLVAGAVGALAWYVVEGPTGHPLPRWVINLGSVTAVGWLLFDLYWQRGDVIVAMGHFTMWLQIVLLYAHKTSRDYAQILVLSMLQMIGASVLSVSMLFGLMLAAYCVLSLFTVLLFQIKLTSDVVLDANRASAPIGVEVERPSPVFGRRWRWHFRATALSIGLACAFIGALVFIALPRTSRFQPTSTPLAPALAHKQTGFSPQVQLSGVPPAPGNREPILNLTLRHQGKNMGSETLSVRLRGAACDNYDHVSHQWTRSRWISALDMTIDPVPKSGARLGIKPGGNWGDSAADLKPTPKLDFYDAQVMVTTADPRALFAPFPPLSIGGVNLSGIVFNPLDQQLSLSGGSSGPIAYLLRIPIEPSAEIFAGFDAVTKRARELSNSWSDPSRISDADLTNYARGWPARDQEEKLRRLATEVIAKAGLSRENTVDHQPNDRAIVETLAQHLRTNFRYSLSNPAPKGLDEPILDFLFINKKGHCELFASGLAALTRSLGMRSRVVTGYLAAEFNRVGGYYVVRQEDAHAWTEVHLAQGWTEFDSTPSAAVESVHRAERGLLSFIRETYEHIEFMWLASVVAYDKESRQRFLQSLQQTWTDTTATPTAWVHDTIESIKTAITGGPFEGFVYTFSAIIVVTILIGIASLIRMAIVRRRRIIALQLTRLTPAQRKALSRRLKFYLTMLDLLERHGYVRPTWQSPFSFAQELAEANPMRFDPVVALTEMFYEVRFGHRDLDNDRRTRIRAHLRQLEENLAEA